MSEMISVASGFQYSVNIGYDLTNDDKLKNFIPTKSALELLEDILLSTRSTSTDRARVLIGAYVTATGIVKKVDDYERLITMKDGTKIPMDDVYSIESEIFKALD